MNIHLGSSISVSGNFLTKVCSSDSLDSKNFSKYFLFKLPYLENIFRHFKKESKELIYKHLPDTMFRFIRVTKNLKQSIHFKDTQWHLLKNNVVQRLNCSCGSFFIGQTRRNLVNAWISARPISSGKCVTIYNLIQITKSTLTTHRFSTVLLTNANFPLV